MNHIFISHKNNACLVHLGAFDDKFMSHTILTK